MRQYSHRSITENNHTYKLHNEVISTLYLDFNATYTQLYQIEPSLAFTFASTPTKWLKWIEGHALKILYGEVYKRKIIKRICYMNSNTNNEYKSAFIRAGFIIIESSPITKEANCPTDIKLVMDCIDDLYHPSCFEEFIIISSDIDFTPLLLRLQEFSRKTLFLSIGKNSQIYNSSVTWKIREDWFIKQAILEDASHSSPPVLKEPNMDKIPNINLDLHKHIAKRIIKMVHASNVPISIAHIAHILQTDFNATEEWFGYGKFKDFLDILPLDGIAFSSIAPGYLYSPTKHDVQAGVDLGKQLQTAYPQISIFAEILHTITDIPLLLPETYKVLLMHTVKELQKQDYSTTIASRNIRDACSAEGFHIARTNINFILLSLEKTNYIKSTDISIDSLIKSLISTIITTAKEHKYIISKEEEEILTEWLKGDYTED